MFKLMMRSKKAGPTEELPEGCDVSAPSVKNKQAKKDHSRWFSAICCTRVEEAVMEELNTPPCGKSGGVVSTSGINPAVLTEELRNTLPSNMKMEDLIEVLEKISAWVKVAVKEVVAQDLIPIVRNLMLERIAALDRVKAQMSCRGTRSVLSDTDLSEEALQSGIVRRFVKTASETFLQERLGLTSWTKPDNDHYGSRSASVTEADLEVRLSLQRCCSELSALIALTLFGDVAGITISWTEQDHTGSALQSAAQTVDVGLEKKSWWFRFPRFLKLRFKKRTT
ncbi:uncharacterized protein LOC143504699 [Brachyhypopomus gauderio]|uniref:uncharacterized protein LOC143504699 n=1 Tax=Brachyhypopomus gauderio TaxID=698409 RepID=UPI004041ED33